MTMPITFANREDFIAALEATRPYWAEVDRKNTERHQLQERHAFEAFQTSLRQLQELSYDDLKARMEFNDSDDRWDEEAGEYKPKLPVGASFKPPSCPISHIATLDRVLARLNTTQQKSFKLDGAARGQNYNEAYALLTGEADEKAKPTVC